MQRQPKTGTRHQFHRIVEPNLCIQFEGLPPVLSTPHLIWLLEESCMELLEDYLVEDEMSLGTHVDVEHLAPALIGDNVCFRSVIVQASGRDLLFRVEATNGDECLARGLHRRTVVSRNRLARKLNR